MNWEEEVDKVAGVKTPTEESIFTKPKTGIDKKFLTVEEGGTMRTDVPVFVDRSQLAGLPPLDSKGKVKVAEAKNEVDWMLAVDKAIKSQSAPKEKSYDWEKTLDKGLEIFNTIPSTIKGINEAVNAYTGGIAGAVVGGTYSIGKSLLEYVGKAIGDNIASKMAGNKNYKPQEVDWEANKTEGERLGQKVAKIPFGIFSSGEPETPLGKALTTPPPMTGGVGLKQLAESLDPRRLISAPAEIAKEAVDLVNESWGVPKDSFLRHADTTISEFASYILGAKVYKGLRDTVAARFHKNAWDDLTPDQKQIVALDLEDLISRGYSEGEVLRRWGSPELFAQALSRRNRGEGVEAPKRSPIVPAQEAPSTAPERAITFPPERAFKPPTSDRAITMGDRRPVAVSEPFSPGETPEPYTHKSDEVAPTGSAQVQPVPDSPAKFMVREELKKKLVDGSIKFPPRMEKTVEATTTAEGDVDETAWMDLVDEAAGIKKEVEIPAIFKTMHIDDLKKFASDKVIGARAEIAKRKAAGTTEPIIESEMSKTDVLAGENISGKTEKVTTKTISPSNYLPTDNLFNKPDLKRNSTYAWRSMGESEFNKLMSGEKEYLGDKQASKGNFLAGIPESAGQFGGKGKFLVEFGGVKIAGDEGLVKGSKATVDNVTKVWKYNDRIKSWEEFKVTKNKPSEGTSGSFSSVNPVFSKATPSKELSTKSKKKTVTKKVDKKKLGEEAEKSANSALQALESKEEEPKKKITAKGILSNESGAVAVYTPPGFYSKLQEVVEVKMSGKMEIDQLKKMLKNNGVSDAEIDATLSGLEGKVTKQQVMEEIAINGVEFKDVVLGMTDKKYQDILNAEVSRANKFLQAQDTDIRKRASEIAAGDPHDLIAFASHVSNNSSYMPVGKYKASEDFINIEDTELPTHYEQYSEPGYVPGSYREMFVTAPKTRDMILPKPTDTAEKYMQDFAEFARRNNISYDEPFDFIDRSVLSEEDLLLLNSLEDRYYALEESGGFDLGGTPIIGGWNDGHGAYANVKNPIVRIRFDERKIDNKKVLFVEEMQGPSTFNQEKMPDTLKKRIYDIGVKKILSYAKENGFDSVAWTTGDMQTNRYDLSKQVNSIKWKEVPGETEWNTYHFTKDSDATKFIEDRNLIEYTTYVKVYPGPGEGVDIKVKEASKSKQKFIEVTTFNTRDVDMYVNEKGIVSN
jgi:hypothetical protein